MGNPLNLLTAGALATGYVIAALFFARFWRDTHDRLFAWFTVAFVLLALQRVALSLYSDDTRAATLLYALRLVAFLVILYAIIDKNRARGAAG